MTTDDILRMVRAVADKDKISPIAGQRGEEFVTLTVEELGRFAALVAAAEREECAKVCDITPPQPFRPSIEAAHAIRARGTK